MPRVKTSYIESPAAQLMHQPRGHWAGFNPHADVLAATPADRALDLLRVGRALTPPQLAACGIDYADGSQLLRHV